MQPISSSAPLSAAPLTEPAAPVIRKESLEPIPTSPLATGESLELSEPRQTDMPEPLRFEEPATATAKGKGPVKAPVKKPAPPEPVKVEPPAPKEDPDAGIEKPPRLNGSKRLPEKEDDALYEMYLGIQREVRDETKALEAHLSDSDKKNLIVDKMLTRLGQEAYVKLPDAQKTALREFVSQFELKDLVLAEVQSEGGADAVEGIVTGTGVDGHYTSSMLHSLQGLMNTGRFTPELLGALNQLRSAPLHPDLEPQHLTLLRSTLQELAFPERIEQHSKGTCAPTTNQILLALRDPVKYTHLVTALAGPDGKVPAAELNGKTGMERESDTLKDDRSGRSLSSRLIQPAFMEFANGDDNYDNTKDRNSNGKGEYSGLDEHGSIRLLDGLFGSGSYALRFVNANPDPSWKGFVKPEVFMKEIATALQHGTPVPAGIRWGESAHKVLLTKIDETKGLAYFMNPWGEMQNMPLETLKRRIDSASLPKAEPSEQDALAALPGKSGQVASYEPIHSWRYYKITDYLLEDPTLKNLSDERKGMLREKFRTLKLSTDYATRQMDVLSRLTQAGLADDKLYDRLSKVRDKDELAGIVRLYAAFDKLPLEKFKTLIETEPDKNLDTIWYAMLMDDLDKPEIFDQLVSKANENKVAAADGSGQQRQQVQAGLKDAFVALEAGNVNGLKPLVAQADEAGRAFMLRKVIDNWPPGKAEDATDQITEGLNTQQLKYLLQALDPTRLVYGDNDAVRRYLRSEARVAARQHAAQHS